VIGSMARVACPWGSFLSFPGSLSIIAASIASTSGSLISRSLGLNTRNITYWWLVVKQGASIGKFLDFYMRGRHRRRSWWIPRASLFRSSRGGHAPTWIGAQNRWKASVIGPSDQKTKSCQQYRATWCGQWEQRVLRQYLIFNLALVFPCSTQSAPSLMWSPVAS